MTKRVARAQASHSEGGEKSREETQEKKLKRESSRETYKAREDASFQVKEGRRFKGRE